MSCKVCACQELEWGLPQLQLFSPGAPLPQPKCKGVQNARPPWATYRDRHVPGGWRRRLSGAGDGAAVAGGAQVARVARGAGAQPQRGLDVPRLQVTLQVCRQAGRGGGEKPGGWVAVSWPSSR
jgi:hypothetical protein